jgi:hypothetical protein
MLFLKENDLFLSPCVPRHPVAATCLGGVLTKTEVPLTAGRRLEPWALRHLEYSNGPDIGYALFYVYLITIPLVTCWAAAEAGTQLAIFAWCALKKQYLSFPTGFNHMRRPYQHYYLLDSSRQILLHLFIIHLSSIVDG